MSKQLERVREVAVWLVNHAATAAEQHAGGLILDALDAPETVTATQITERISANLIEHQEGR